MWEKIWHKWIKRPYILATDEYARPQYPQATIILLHGLGGSSHMWMKLVNGLPENVRIIGIDLLGFGDSPRPDWVRYDANTQAQSVRATLRQMRVKGPLIIVGHSLGALVAVETVLHINTDSCQLILCSPPFYQSTEEDKQRLPNPDAMLKSLYRSFGSNPQKALSVLALAGKLGIINPGFKVDETNIDAYIATLDTAIINQSVFRDINTLTIPIEILSGRFDIVVIDGNIKKLVQTNPYINWIQVAAGHEIQGRYRTELRNSIRRAIDRS